MNTNTLHISREDTVRQIQHNFSRLFPALTIRFYSQNEKSCANDSCVMFSPDSTVRDINPECQDGFIMIKEGMMVYELENLFFDQFGLLAEISARTGNQILNGLLTVWLLKEKDLVLHFPFKNMQRAYFKDVPFGC